MRVEGVVEIKSFIEKHREYKKALDEWLAITRGSPWKSFQDIRKTFRSASWVIPRKGKRVVVFNIKGKKIRLVASVSFQIHKPTLFVLFVLTHDEYTKESWKKKV